MDGTQSDALVFFGATGDLAYKKIFPALQSMVKRGHLNVPVVGVAKSGWNLDNLRERARDSVQKHGGLDPQAFEKLSSLLRYVDGDYADPAPFSGGPQRTEWSATAGTLPGHSPLLFGIVVEQFGEIGFRRGRSCRRRETFRQPRSRNAGAQPDSRH